jgi:uncharacterized oxidoreductase
VIEVVLPLVDTDMTRDRGHDKISAAQAASAVIGGIRRDDAEIYVGKTKLVRTIMRLSPSLGYRLLRDS